MIKGDLSMPLPAESNLYMVCIYAIQEVGRVELDRVIDVSDLAEHAGLPHNTLSYP